MAQLNTQFIADHAITNIKLATIPAHSYIGNNTGSTATAADITSTQLTADLDLFTSTLQGLVPASGGGTTTFLRADGTFATPAGTGGTVTTVSIVSANGLAGTVANATTTPAITLSTTITGILQGNGTAISAATTTGSGSVVLATSPTLVTPALGTPSALVGTNITGTAAGLTAGNVTTNANLTGVVTSVGNATTLATDGVTVKVNGSTQVEALQPAEEQFTLSGTDITNQYVDLSFPVFGTSASANSVTLWPVGGPMQQKTVDYTVSLTGGTAGVTRVTFAGDLATGGPAALIAGNVLVINYSYLA